MSRDDAAELARRLGRQAEAVCRRYLSNGRREGRYWLVGDVRNTPGRSMFVRLTGPESGKGAAGKWSDTATGEHGDLLDVIGESCGLPDFKDVAAEARLFLRLAPPPPPARTRTPTRKVSKATAARRLTAMSQPISGTIVQTYLHERAITALHETGALRFHPRCYYRPEGPGPTEAWPAMIASVTDLDGAQTGAHRTWLAPDGSGKAPVDTPRRAMGDILGHAVRFGEAGDVMAAGEGIETTLSPRSVLPHMPMMATLSAGHLGAVLFPRALRRLYVLHDPDPAGAWARDRLIDRTQAVGIEAFVLSPTLGDFNEDLVRRGVDALRAALRDQLAPEDVARFMAF